MTHDTEGLHEIANTTAKDRKADIVFVHGLGGSSHSTWRYGKEGTPGHFFWPEELGKERTECGVWSVGYPAGFTGLGARGMIIEKRAGNLADKLINAGLGDRPIIFVTHSMGGLILKYLIVDSQSLPGEDRKRIVAQTRGIVFCGTPHKGSDFSNAAGVFGILGGGSQAHVKEMCANEEKLDFLHVKFVEWHRLNPVPIVSFAENKKLSLTSWLFFWTNYGVVVPRASANPAISGCECHDSDDDHLTLVKPRNSRHDVYAGVLRFIEKALLQAPSSAELDATTSDQVSSAPKPVHADISRIDKYAPAQLIGREAEIKLLNDAWDQAVRGDATRPHVLTFVALGGEGKTSLVAKWAADLAHRNWPGCEAVLAWSFYSQGTRDQVAASSDLFLKEALVFFGDEAMANSPQGAYDKGKRLAHLVGERRALLILDGLEPLQYPTTSPLAGQLKDQGMSALLKGLAQKNAGLCIVTTRYSVTDLRAYWQTASPPFPPRGGGAGGEGAAPEIKLLRLSKEAGVELLKSLGVKGTQTECEQLVEDVNGHALTLNLLGKYLADAHAGDIRRRALVKLEEADAEEGAGHAFHVMDAYVLWFETGPKEEEERAKGRRAIALLRLLGLFDRPTSADCIAALKQPPVIPGLTEVLVGMSEAQQNIAFKRLEEAKLLTVTRDAAGTLISLDAHPLVREYFARQLRTQQPDAWRAAHRRLYEHLCATTKEGKQPTLEDLQPLYQAVAHGCQAGMQQDACDKVYIDRIILDTNYSVKKLGAYGSDLGAVACFFEQPWTRISYAFAETHHGWLMNNAAFRLRALGRLNEALELMRACREIQVTQEKWKAAAVAVSNLSELELTLGEVAEAVRDAEQCVIYADRSVDAFWAMATRTTHGDALHQAGLRAEHLFAKAEAIQAFEAFPLLYSQQGFVYCDLLLGAPERVAWKRTLDLSFNPQDSSLSAVRDKVSKRATQTLQWVMGKLGLLDEALDRLTLGRTALYEAILEGSSLDSCRAPLQNAVDGLRRAGTQHYVPRGLLTRAWLRSLTGARTGPDSAQADLDEAWEIAERGPMRLHMADIHLHRARLFFRAAEYPWESPAADLDAAEKLINACGYHRRDGELADAKVVILAKP